VGENVGLAESLFEKHSSFQDTSIESPTDTLSAKFIEKQPIG
jgi:hypothetical protein